MHNPTIPEAYEYLLTEPNDMHFHLPYLTDIAIGQRVVEFGVRTGVSTTALLHGRPLWLQSYDIERCAGIDELEQSARSGGYDWTFHEESSLWADIPECDVLLIDSLHTYQQLRLELARHACAVGELIVMHDTSTYGQVSEDGSAPGLQAAIDEFLACHREWALARYEPECNGLTTLRRVE